MTFTFSRLLLSCLTADATDSHQQSHTTEVWNAIPFHKFHKKHAQFFIENDKTFLSQMKFIPLRVTEKVQWF